MSATTATGADERRPPVTRHGTDVGTAQLSYLACGPEHGDVVLCLHGIPASAELWRDVLGALGAAGYRALAPDLPGYGRTRLPANGDRSLAGAATLLAGWLGSLRTGPVWVVGHDLGGAVAQLLAVHHPDTVARLTLSDTVFDDNWPVRPIALARAIARTGAYPLLARLKLVPNPYMTWELTRAFADPSRLSDGDRRRVFWDEKVWDARGRLEFAGHLKALDSAQTVAIVDDLARVEVPLQFVWAMQDPHQPWAPNGENLRDAFERGRQPEDYASVTLIDDAGHFVPLERPERFAAALLDWRAST